MTILFDIFPAVGHFNASFALANKLLQERHRIVYCADAENKLFIKDKGFECIVVDYPIEPDKQELRNKGVSFIMECFISVFTQNRKRTFFRKIADWENRVKELSPDRVYLDAQCAMRTAYHKLGLRANIKWDSSRKIEKRIVQILENQAALKRNLAVMKEKILNENATTYTKEK